MALNLEVDVVNKLKATHHLLYAVESCTGGLISHLITNVSGASSVFCGSTVAYDNAFKQELGVPEEIITIQGAVSSAVAGALAEQGLHKLQNNALLAHSYSLLKPKGLVCLSITGIAGPTGGSIDKPVGLCFIGLAKTDRPTIIETFQVTSSTTHRSEIKNQFAHKALEFLLNNL